MQECPRQPSPSRSLRASGVSGISQKSTDSVRACGINPIFWEAASSAREADTANRAVVQALKRRSKVRFIVVSADDACDHLPPDARKAADATCRAGHQRIWASSPRDRPAPVGHASHNIQGDRPDAIADAEATAQIGGGKPRL
ncbi:MAG: hypothetical protein ABIQ70_01220 [Dokdonella sp.]